MKARMKKEFEGQYKHPSDSDTWYDCYFFLLGGELEMLVQDISIEEACFGNREHFDIKEND